MKKLFYILFASALFTSGCSGTRPVASHNGGPLAPCPDSPNCVSSRAEDSRHHVPPITFDSSGPEAMEHLITVLGSMKRVKIVTHDTDYLHAEFTSAIFRFVDDVEFHVDNENKVLHVRSASRIGYSDLGANRKRIEGIRKRFNGEV